MISIKEKGMYDYDKYFKRISQIISIRFYLFILNLKKKLFFL